MLLGRVMHRTALHSNVLRSIDRFTAVCNYCWQLHFRAVAVIIVVAFILVYEALCAQVVEFVSATCFITTLTGHGPNAVSGCFVQWMDHAL